jgi:RNA polymerase primary sigma factor
LSIDYQDTLQLHQADIGRFPMLTPHQERRAALRIEASRRRYHLTALRLEHVARSLLAVFRRVQTGDMTADRVCRMAKTELVPPARLSQLAAVGKGARDAEVKAALNGRLAAHLPLAAHLLSRCGPLFRAGRLDELGLVRAKIAHLLYEVGVRTAKIDGLVREAEHTPPGEQNETADSLAAAVARCRVRAFTHAECKRVMVRGNVRLVWRQAKLMNQRFGGDKESMGDLLQDGYTGLMKAADKYEVRTGNRFSTVAAIWIDQAMRKAVGDHGRTVRVPSHTREVAGLVHWAWVELEASGLETTTAAVVKRIKETRGKSVSEAEAERADRAVQPVASFGDEDGEDGAGQSVADDAVGVEEAAVSGDAVDAVLSVLRLLPYRQREILKLQTGIGDGWRYDLAACARVFGISRERVRQLKVQAMAALRQPGMLEFLAPHL